MSNMWTDTCLITPFGKILPPPLSIAPFDDVSPSMSNDPCKLPKNCFCCQQSLLNPGNLPAPCVSCPKCKQYFCLDCDIYIHENLHNCPGCEGFRDSKSNTMEE